MRFNRLARTALLHAYVDGHRLGSGLLAPVRRTRVTGLRCPRCRTWVAARRWDPGYDVCTTCLPAVKAAHRAQIRAAQRREDQATDHFDITAVAAW